MEVSGYRGRPDNDASGTFFAIIIIICGGVVIGVMWRGILLIPVVLNTAQPFVFH